MSTLGTTLVQTTAGGTSATSSYVLTLNQATTKGNMIVVFAYSGDSVNEFANNPTDDAGNNYGSAFIGGVPLATGPYQPYVTGWLAKNTAPATQITVTFHGTGAANKLLIAREYTHEDLIYSNEAEQSALNTSTGTISVTSAAFTNPDILALGLVHAVDTAGTPSWTNNGTYGNFLQTSVTDSGGKSAFVIADSYLYNATGVTTTFQASASGTTLHNRIDLVPIVIEGGVRRTGDGAFGVGDGGFGVSG